MKSLVSRWPFLFLVASGCSSTPPSDAPESPPVPAQKEASASWAQATQNIRGIAEFARMAPFSVRVYDAHDQLAYAENFGGYDELKAVPVASAAKWTTAATVLSLVEQGVLPLESITGSVLGWTGEKGNIRLEELLSLRSGLVVRAGETLSAFGNPKNTLQQSVLEMGQKTELANPPGHRFQYGSLPLQIAAAMAEKASGKTWNALFEAALTAPLGLSSMHYYVGSPGNVKPANPVVAGAMVSNTPDYVSFLRMVFHKGVFGKKRVLAQSTIETMEADGFAHTRMPPADSPLRRFFGAFHYAGGHWIECRGEKPGEGLPQKCDANSPRSSLGAAGWYPWFDRETGYYALLSTVQVGDSDLRVAALTKAIFDVKAEVAKAAEKALR